MTERKQVALITGGSSGIGLGIAQEFAKAGYDLLLNGLEENGDEIAGELAATHEVKVRFSPTNLMDPEAVRSMVHQAESDFGRLDVLINNAGVQHVAPIDEFPEGKWDLILGVNLSAAFHTSKAAWPGMKARGFGRIINVASAHGLRASEYKAAYVASKHGILGLTKVLALEGAPHNITCNAICPGYVKTPLVEAQIEDQAKAHGISEKEVIQEVMLKKQAVKSFVGLETLGQLALFLASDYANTLTGTAIPVDGGWTAQ
jgi:3-hydroxybutyrate dehydrogenase